MWRSRHAKCYFFYSTGNFSFAISPEKCAKFDKKLIHNKTLYSPFGKIIMIFIILFNCLLMGQNNFPLYSKIILDKDMPDTVFLGNITLIKKKRKKVHHKNVKLWQKLIYNKTAYVQKFYISAGRDGRDIFHVCVGHSITSMNIKFHIWLQDFGDFCWTQEVSADTRVFNFCMIVCPFVCSFVHLL